MRALFIPLAVALLASGASAQNIFESEVNLTLKGRLTVQGNVEAIDRGLAVTCSLSGEANAGAVSETVELLQPGEVFVPQTPEGFIDWEVSFDGLTTAWATINDVDEGRATFYSCQTFFLEPYSRVFKPSPGGGVQAVEPAWIGTCGATSASISVTGETMRDVERRCATQ